MALYGYVISPVLRSGYTEDDRFDSIWAVTRKAKGVSGFEDGVHWTQVFISGLGRFHPLAHVLGAYSFEITNVHTYKLVSFIATLVAVYVVALFLILWTNKKEIAVLYLLVLSSISQFRIVYDPILSFGLHTKILLILFGSQLVILAKIKKDRNPRIWLYLLLSALLICSGLYHEVSVMLILALLPLALIFTGRKKLIVLTLVSWTFISYWLVRISLYYAVSENINQSFYQLTLSPSAVAKTYIQQLSGLVPFLSTREWKQPDWEKYAFAAGAVVPTLVLLIVVQFKTRDRNISHDHITLQRNVLALGLCGLLLVLLPGTVGALSVGHGDIGIWWDGYINVWAMQIGLSIGTAAAIFKLWVKRPEKLFGNISFAVICLFFFIIIPIKVTNDKIVDQNPRWTQNTVINGWEREQTLRALKNGFLSSENGGFQLMSLPPRVWMSKNYLETISSNVIPLNNSWDRFAPMPLDVLEGCREKKKVQTVGSFERTYTCQSADGLITSSFATSFKDGFSVTGVPEQISMSDDPMIEQFRMNKSRTYVKNIRLFLSGKYERCKTVNATSAKGESIKYQLIRTSRVHNYLLNPTSGIDLYSLKLSNCA
jgi:hypothetical protein